MCSKCARGFTLVEMIIAMVIISVGIAGVLGVLSSTSLHSADPIVTKQLTAIAEGMMEEIQLKPFRGPGTAPPNGCARTAFDEISDYNGYAQDVCDITGTPGPTGYRVQIAITKASGAFLDGDIPADDTHRIEVVVSHGNERFALIGWRNDFGGKP